MELEKTLKDIEKLKAIIDSQEHTLEQRLDAFRKATSLIEDSREYLKSVELEIEEIKSKGSDE